jgi:hypothetical protein
MHRYINYVVELSIILCLVLVIFPALKTSSYGGNFISKYENIIMLSIVNNVSFILLELFCITTMHPIQSSIFGILFILTLACSSLVGEVRLFSWTSIIPLISWAIVIASFVKALRKLISRVKILYSQK